MTQTSMRVWLYSGLLGSLLCWSTGVMAAEAPTPPPANATAAQLASCAEARAAFNAKAHPNYTYRVQSQRKGYSMEGVLEENYKIIKNISVSGDTRQETFLRGEKNGKEADVSDFWMERLGMSAKYTAEAMNMFDPQKRGHYTYTLAGTEKIGETETFKLEFKVKETGAVEMQHGFVWIERSSCAPVRANGRFPDVWVTELINAKLDLVQTKPGFWLPAEQRVDMLVSMPFMKRKALMIDHYSEHKVQ